MSCGCKNKPRRSVMTGQGLEPCSECVISHLQKARGLLKDATKGKLKFQYAVIWHLASAANKTPHDSARLREALLEARRNYQRDGVSPDWEAIFQLITNGE